MTHTASHIIIQFLATDTGKGKVYLYVLGFGAFCFFLGALLF